MLQFAAIKHTIVPIIKQICLKVADVVEEIDAVKDTQTFVKMFPLKESSFNMSYMSNIMSEISVRNEDEIKSNQTLENRSSSTQSIKQTMKLLPPDQISTNQQFESDNPIQISTQSNQQQPIQVQQPIQLQSNQQPIQLQSNQQPIQLQSNQQQPIQVQQQPIQLQSNQQPIQNQQPIRTTLPPPELHSHRNLITTQTFLL